MPQGRGRGDDEDDGAMVVVSEVSEVRLFAVV